MKDLQDLVAEIPATKTDKGLKRKWSMELQNYCDEQSVSVGDYDGYCVCGNMNFCDYCKEYKCYQAIKKLAEIKGIVIDYSDYDFKKLIERLEVK